MQQTNNAVAAHIAANQMTGNQLINQLGGTTHTGNTHTGQVTSTTSQQQSSVSQQHLVGQQQYVGQQQLVGNPATTLQGQLGHLANTGLGGFTGNTIQHGHNQIYLSTENTPLNTQSPMSAFGADAYHSETRKVSSVVLETSTVGEVSTEKDTVRYVEVPTIEEQVKYVTVHEVREVEKRVPKYNVEYVDRIVEVPRNVYVDIPNTAVEYVDRIVEKKIPNIVPRPVEVIVEKKVPRTRMVEKVVNVPGEVIEVPKPYTVENKVEVPRHVDREIPVVVAQTIKPIITESDRTLAVDVLDYEPEVVPVDVHVAKPVASALEIVGQRDARHRLVNITSGQYNTILRRLNVHMDDKTRQCLPYVSEAGRVPFVEEREAHFIVAPEGIEVEGWNRPITTIHHQTREVASLHSNMIMESQHANKAACCNTNTKKKPTTTTTYTSEVVERPSHSHPNQTYSQASHPLANAYSQQSQQPIVYHDRRGSASKSHASHLQTDHTHHYTENREEKESIRSATVLSHRPQQKSRVCC